MSAPVIAAIDLGPLTGRVLYHAAAFARLLQVQLRVLYVTADRSDAQRQRVLEACLQVGPYRDFDDTAIVLRPGRVSDAIAREAIAEHASLIVVGSRASRGVSKLLLGSTSETLLKNATTPVLLVPPIDIDIVSLGERAALTCGPVLAAVDLSENAGQQLRLAGKLARIGSQPLLLMTVAKSRVTDHDAAQQLRRRAHDLAPPKPRALIVRRGDVVDEITRCALAEGAGLVVMGLRASPRCQPGSIASAVLRTRRAFVLAVPNAKADAATARGGRRLEMIVALLLTVLSATGLAMPQHNWRDPAAIAAFQRAADSYAFVHRQAERQLGLAHRAAGDATAPIQSGELADAIRARRPRAGGELFTPTVVTELRASAATAINAGCDAGELRSGLWQLGYTVYASATGTKRVAPCVAEALPALPEELEYRSAGTVLLVVDRHANLIVDVLPALLAGSELRR